ncbi:hypothetical protein PsyrH_13085 [Pseudomonas syringae pv. syringae HS191]|nr:hypothetical protein PsyrH_13085 [Pseudomonas syringae pv. syringae HS191]
MARTQPTQPVTELERTTMRRVAWRLLPFLIRPGQYRHGIAADES